MCVRDADVRQRAVGVSSVDGGAEDGEKAVGADSRKVDCKSGASCK
jgi:hypothetical protein